MKINKILSLVLSTALVCSLWFSVFAEETFEDHQVVEKNNNISVGVSDLTVEVIETPSVLIATVPIEIPIVVDTRGDVTVPTDLKIINNTDKKITVTKVTTTPDYSSFGLVQDEYTFNGENPMNWKLIKIFLNNECLGGEGNTYTAAVSTGGIGNVETNWEIEGNSDLPLEMSVEFMTPNGYDTVGKVVAGTISFTISLTD